MPESATAPSAPGARSAAIAAWLEAWFRARGPVPDDLATANVFTAGVIDSFGVIELIEAAEARFGMRFSEAHFQDRRFPTIPGLAEIIAPIATTVPPLEQS